MSPTASLTKKTDKWVDQKRSAVELISAIGHLMYDKNVELVLFRSPLMEVGVSNILDLHQYATDVVNKPIDVHTTAELANVMTRMDLAPSKIDIGRLSREWKTEGSNYATKEEFMDDKLGKFVGHQASSDIKPRDVVLYGFGRIGRLCARELIRMSGVGQQLRLRAIVLRKVDADQIKKRASLLSMDSVHGKFNAMIQIDPENNKMTIDGQDVLFIQGGNPEDVDYTAHGIENALLIDNTGAFTDKEALSRHMKAKGVNKVLLTAPGKEIPNIVYGINHQEFDLDANDIYSAASCTTNAISPILQVVESKYGVVKGHLETIHAYTNDQNLLDNMHKKPRRGRSAAINMVITSTGAGNAVTKVIPSLADKLTANAVRVPTPNGSLAILNLELGKEVSLEEINSTMKAAALEGELVNQIKFATEEELVSNDIIGNTCCSIYDSHATIVSKDKKNVVLYVWYDNEFGYTKQVLRLAKYIAKVRRMIYY
ncbi:MAG: glyceraldehyde 3-phosphate dehydrogenase [Patiriisocius sp.]|jgi:glyceraldehyde 3-phosphate dehydrogenase